MDDTTRITIPCLELPVGPYEAVSVRGNAPVPVQVVYCYEPGEPEVHTFANGDPGEPGCPPYFDFKHIWTVESLVLASTDGKIRTLIAEGTDIHDMLALSELAAVESIVMAQRQFEADQARIDAAGPRRRRAQLGGRA